MSVTSGFFNSQDGDRRYNAEQMSSIFDGVITDGIFQNYLNAFAVSPGTGLQVVVASGRCWFDHTWIYNDSDYSITVTAGKKYFIVFDIDHTDSVRSGSIKLLTGTSSAYPSLASTDDHTQYKLVSLDIPAGATSVTTSMIYDWRGSDDCPWTDGILSSATVRSANAAALQQAQLAASYAALANNYKEQVVAEAIADRLAMDEALDDMQDYADEHIASANEALAQIESEQEVFYDDMAGYATKDEYEGMVSDLEVYASGRIQAEADELRVEFDAAYQEKVLDEDGDPIYTDKASFDSYISQKASDVVIEAEGNYYTKDEIKDAFDSGKTSAQLSVGAAAIREKVLSQFYTESEVDGIEEDVTTYASTEVETLANGIATSMASYLGKSKQGTYDTDGTASAKSTFFTNNINQFADGISTTLKAYSVDAADSENLISDTDVNTADAVYQEHERYKGATGSTSTWTYNNPVQRTVAGTDWAIRMTLNSANSSAIAPVIIFFALGDDHPEYSCIQVEEGETYTFSYYARASAAGMYNPRMGFLGDNGYNGQFSNNGSTYISTDWKQYTTTITVSFSGFTSGQNYFTTTYTDGSGNSINNYWQRVQMGFLCSAGKGTAGSWVEMTGIKVERGSVATAWSPAPSDVSGKAVVKAYNYTDETATEVKHEMWGEGSYAGGTYDMKHYTDETAQELVDQFRCVDGNNLLLDSDVSSLTAVAADYNRYTSTDSGTLNCESFESISSYIAGTQYAAKFDLSKFSHSNGETHMTCWYSGGGVTVVPGETYTFSAYFKPTVAGIIPQFEFGTSSYAACYEGTNNAVVATYTIDSQLSAPANAWTKCYWTVQFPPYTGYTNYYSTWTAGSETLYYTRIYMGCRVPNGSTLTSGYMYMTAPMFEKGAVAHEYKENTVYTNTSIRNAYMSSNVCKALIGDQWVSSLISQTPSSIDLTANNITLSGKVFFGSTGVNAASMLASTIPYYARSSSKTTAPTSGWSTSYPTTNSTYPYVWSKNLLTFVNGTTSYTTAQVQNDISVANSANTAATEAKTLAKYGYQWLQYFRIGTGNGNESVKIARVNVQYASYVTTPITFVLNTRRGRLTFTIQWSSNGGDLTTTPYVIYFYLDAQQDSYYNKNNLPTASNYSSFKVLPYLIQNSGNYDVYLYCANTYETVYIESVEGCNLTASDGTVLRSGIPECHMVTLMDGTTIVAGGLQSGTQHFPIRYKDDCRALYTSGKTTIDGGLITANTIAATRLCINDYATASGSGSIPNIAGWTLDSNSIRYGTWGESGGAIWCAGGTSSAKSIGGSGSISGWVLNCGANFGVTKTGALYCTGANISGTITATSGSFTGDINATSGSFTGTITASGLTTNGTLSSDISLLSNSTITIGSTASDHSYFAIQPSNNTRMFMYASGGTIALTSDTGIVLDAPAFKIDDTEYIDLNASTAVRIGTSSAAKGSVYIYSNSGTDGALQIGGNNTWHLPILKGTELWIDGTSKYSSDRRLKQNIEHTVPDIIDQLKPATFEYKKTPGVKRYGFIAQEVKEVIPELVYQDDTSNWRPEEIREVYEKGESWKYTDPVYTLNYNDIIALLVDKCQSLQKQINELREG